MAPGGPYYLPGLDKQYERVDADGAPSEGATRPVRLDVAQPGEELVALRTWKIEKGSFDRFHAPLRAAAWPFLEKIGVRPIGEWQRFYPEPHAGERQERAAHDKAVMLTRYASYEHWQDTRAPITLGGDGPDYQEAVEAFRTREALAREALARETSVSFLQGYLFQNPPTYAPPPAEHYRKL